MKITYLAFLIALLVLSACDSPSVAEQTDAAEVMPSAVFVPEAKPIKQDIEWFDGGIDQAFALAHAPEDSQRIQQTSMEIFDKSKGMEEFLAGTWQMHIVTGASHVLI